MAEDARVKRIREMISRIMSMPREGFLARGGWGEINFLDLSDVVHEIFSLIDFIAPLPLEKLSNQGIGELTDGVESADKWLSAINNFSLANDNVQRTRQEIQSNIPSALERLRQVSERTLPFLLVKEFQVSAMVEEMQSAVSSVNGLLGSAAEKASQQSTAFEELLEAARNRSAAEGVAAFADSFSTESKLKNEEAAAWLQMGGLFAALTVATIFGFLAFGPDGDPVALVQYVSTKVLVLAIMIGIVTWCAGNYRACRHLATIAGYKANALSTFLTFVRSTDDKAVREQILLETTRAIFVQPQTGFLKHEVGSDQSVHRMVEVFKTNADSS